MRWFAVRSQPSGRLAFVLAVVACLTRGLVAQAAPAFEVPA